ncbi:hypothetical protein Q3O59_10880 [Alkalimonas delamerensis]|uniref:Uncharacterized protein n=1 Tax=Alkalimonas delamerensis TaxID=265981 RepID=A0ABT9GRE1_9GAMM|nr:hypothetical protein [Alkalimonas delamerensis]MDP4529529.1 hypothetical protein [Alkalimonas delamerensis]
MKIEKEIKVLRGAVVACLALSAVLVTTGMRANKDVRFDTLTVERINIVEADGTVKMLLTNTARFPTTEQVNGTVLNEHRKKRSGMLFFNEEGIEAGGFIYDGSKNEHGHSAGMMLAFDKYDGDQVMQLLTMDEMRDGKRVVSSGLAFNDRPEHETQDGMRRIMHELNQIEDPELWRETAIAYQEQGLIGGTQRILLGKTHESNNGLFLFASDGSPRAKFYVDEQDEVQLQFFNREGELTHTWSGSQSHE